LSSLHIHLGLDMVSELQTLHTLGSEAGIPALDDTVNFSRVLTKIGDYAGAGSEISAYDPITKQLFVVATGPIIEILDLSNPSNPTLVKALDFSDFGDASSVAVSNGLVAVSIVSTVSTDPGKVLFLDAQGEILKEITVGSGPDMLTFTPDGKKVLVAIEGEPSSYNQPDSIDPVGEVSIIDLSNGVDNATVSSAGFESFNDRKAELQAKGVRITGPNASVAQDLEPEYIAISPDSKTAWVALQENNAIAIVDIATATVTDILPLGLKNHSLPGNGLDASDRDGKINIQNYPIFGLYQPDGIARFTAANGRTYIVTANEGDGRDYDGFADEVRVGSSRYVLDPTIFPNAAALKQNTALGRLTVSSSSGDLDGDGDFERIEAFGARSFSIFDASIKQVFDSGDQFERITAAALPTNFNSNSENDSFDTRSDNKGPEPEGIAIGNVNGRVYAFVGLERVGGVMTYDVTNPEKPTFVDYTNSRDFTAEVATDAAPEGVAFISANRSPNGKPLLIVNYEVSNNTAIYEFTPPPATGKGGQDGFVVQQGDGTATISDFGGIGTGVNPSAATRAEVDTIKFVGAGLTARNLLLDQKGSDLELTFEGVSDTKVVLNDFALENLDNLQKATGASVDLGNLLFEGQTKIEDSFDVFNRNWNFDRIFNRNSVTFLNDLDNDIEGFNSSNDVINGQGGDDRLSGLGGDDLLRGGEGNDYLDGGQGDDVLTGGEGNDWLIGGKGNDFLHGGSGRDVFALAKGAGTDTIADFEVGNDLLALSKGLSFDRLSILQGIGDRADDTVISLKNGQEAIVFLTNIKANTITHSSFILA
jgi:Ca2+-binding RTX toxin-like protein